MIGILFSGGKDSVFTLHYFLEQGWDVKCLISLKSKNEFSWMFHTPAIEMVSLQANAIGLPILIGETLGEKESELFDLKKTLAMAKAKFEITGVAVGALLSDYQQERVNRVCHSLGLRCFAPLWHKSQEKLLGEMISLGFDVRIVAIAAQGLSKDLLGERVDEKTLAYFSSLNARHGFHVGGEGGEYESLVVDAPFFKKRLVLDKTNVVSEKEHEGRLEIVRAHLEEK
ncbi:MAG: diphthine--ammonia ligase [archaeon]|nr:diphthine--ammonia ligase [archaeon]